MIGEVRPVCLPAASGAREILAKHGLTFMDAKLNRPVARPEVAIERDHCCPN
jgi:hypothetical protein